jgi:L,D-transpeptidase catalytic domain
MVSFLFVWPVDSRPSGWNQISANGLIPCCILPCPIRSARPEPMFMPVSRLALLALAVVVIMPAMPARAAVQVTIDKSTQRMTVQVDGSLRWVWRVSTGQPGHDTPSGRYTAFRMEADHFSKEWDDAPMPHSIFFSQSGHAIHGSYNTRRIGTPASHGCVRLDPGNAARLYELVEKEGLPNTKVVVTGDVRNALFRGRSYGAYAAGNWSRPYRPFGY